MKTVKEILTENRESVISSIKWICKVWRKDDVIVKMREFLAYAEANADVEALSASKRVKTDLKNLVGRMAEEQTRQRNIALYGKERPSLADIMGGIAESQDIRYSHTAKDWVKA